MQVVGDAGWLDDRIAVLKLNIEYHQHMLRDGDYQRKLRDEYHHRMIRETENQLAIMKQHRDAGCHYSPARYPELGDDGVPFQSAPIENLTGAQLAQELAPLQ